MPLPNIFSESVTNEIIKRVNKLTPDSNPSWGKMNAPQMLAHLNVAYEMIYENIHPKPNPFMKFMLKVFVKNKVISEAGYPHSSRTAPQFIITDTKNFETEKQRLINYLNKTLQLGEKHFDNKESPSFGKLSKTEWNNLLYKHLDHHLKQFGV